MVRFADIANAHQLVSDEALENLRVEILSYYEKTENRQAVDMLSHLKDSVMKNEENHKIYYNIIRVIKFP